MAMRKITLFPEHAKSEPRTQQYRTIIACLILESAKIRIAWLVLESAQTRREIYILFWIACVQIPRTTQNRELIIQIATVCAVLSVHTMLRLLLFLLLLLILLILQLLCLNFPQFIFTVRRYAGRIYGRSFLWRYFAWSRFAVIILGPEKLCGLNFWEIKVLRCSNILLFNICGGIQLFLKGGFIFFVVKE